MTRLQELVGDPRPMETKAAEVNQDVQATLADYARRGRVAEEDILRNVAAVLPEELRPLVPQPPVPPPTTTVVVEEEEEEVFDYATFSASEVMEQQALAELADVKQAVASLQVGLRAVFAHPFLVFLSFLTTLSSPRSTMHRQHSTAWQTIRNRVAMQCCA